MTMLGFFGDLREIFIGYLSLLSPTVRFSLVFITAVFFIVFYALITDRDKTHRKYENR